MMGFQQLVEAPRYFINCKVIGELASIYSDLVPPAWCKQDTLLTGARPDTPKKCTFWVRGWPKKSTFCCATHPSRLFVVWLIHQDVFSGSFQLWKIHLKACLTCAQYKENKMKLWWMTMEENSCACCYQEVENFAKTHLFFLLFI